MIAKVVNYIFYPATKKIIFEDVQIVDITRVQYIINVTRNITLYNYSSPTLITTDGTNVVTVSHSTTGMTTNDQLDITYDFPIDQADLPGTGTVTSVAASGGTTGLSYIGSPIIASGTITLSGILNPIHGGTGLSSYTTGDIIYASATNVLSKLPAGINGRVLKLIGGIPSWEPAAAGVGTVTSFSFTNNSTFTGIVVSSTTTPSLTLTLVLVDGGIF